MNVMFISSPGLYVRLRGGFYSTDKLSFLITLKSFPSISRCSIFTAVKNVTVDSGRFRVAVYRLSNLFGNSMITDLETEKVLVE